MNANPKIVFATTCKGRLQHLAQTLPRNLTDNLNYRNAKFVVLDYGDKTGLSDYIRRFHEQNIESGRLAYYDYPVDGQFHVSHAKNMAARCAILEGADILVTLDADNYTGPGLARFIADAFSEPGIKPGLFICPNFPLIKSLPHGPGRPHRGYAGRLAIWAQDFIKMGGYNEHFDTWYGEDIDMIARLQRLGYTMRHFDNKNLNTIPHSAEVRFAEYPHAQQYETADEWQKIYARTETIVNYGHFGMGKVFRNFGSEPIELERVPTRVFGIGMHKTGTSSLHAAFQILGLNSFHWGTGEAPMIWYEMNSIGKSKTLEQWYALSDLPIPLLYRKLDAAYPGSKFILTVRDENDWLKSVEGLWDYKRNSTRYMWDIYPFSNHIHTALYGQKHFDPVVFLNRYRRHNADVKEYFKDRPDDLLVLDIDQDFDETDNKWPELCKFLKLPVPTVPYPIHNKTQHRIEAQMQLRFFDSM